MLIPAQLLSQVPPSLHSIVENYWQDWSVACEGKAIIFQPDLPLELLGKTWACSDFVARNCIRYPQIFDELYQEGFQLPRTHDDYQQLVNQVIQLADDENQLMRDLRVLRQKEMLRISWRDLNALATGEVILHELSDFSEAVVKMTVQTLEKKQAEINGMPCDADGEVLELLTFAMGKMGGRELNFSSDIDLIFAFAENGETSGPRRVSHNEFYLSVVRKLVTILNEVTADGFVYRVDTRLRPFGDSGPLVISVSGMEQYYQLQGRDWERYAMIKAKLITGRKADRNYLQSMLSPFIYRRYLDYSMLESIREMKAMINAQMKRKRMANNIKLGRGGIREIEFIGQTLQLIRAGREPELRERSIVKVLSLLAEKQYLQKEEVGNLLEAYWFLRKLENRLQMQRDMQIHVLPEDEELKQRLCLAMGMSDWQELLSQLEQHQHCVDQVFENIIAHDTADIEHLPFSLLWEDEDSSDDLHVYLVKSGYTDADAILKSLSELRKSPQIKAQTGDNRRRLEQLFTSLITQIASYPQQAKLLDRVSRIIKALVGRKVYISLLTEFPRAQQQMLKLCAASEWFTERLLKHPILLDGLLVSKEILQQQYDQKHLLGLELNRIDSQGVAEDDLEQVMDRMRQFKRQTMFNVAVIDVFYDEPVETVSDRLTELANVVLEKVLALSWQAMVEKHGTPECVVDGVIFHPTMSIVAYGKLGGNELGYGSDLDIIFLHDSSGEKQYTSDEKALDNQSFFARVAQRVIHFLNARTYSGILYEVDTRLRPNGQSGLMVSSISAFETYQREKAWTWEHQALIRARFVTGSALIEQEFDRIRSSVLRRSRETTQLLLDVVTMREKMRKHLANKTAGFDFKQDAGGLVDIEFMTQAGVLIHAERYVDCIAHTATLELINELTKVGWYEVVEAEDISNAYRYFRRLKNWQNLGCEIDVSKTGQHCEKVVAVWKRLMPEVSQGMAK